MTGPESSFALSCPIPIEDYPHVLLGHGGGGRLTRQLIERMFLPAFENPMIQARHDGAVMPIGKTKIAFSTDSYVVRPLFFPGGDIGSLSVYGTVNDLAMCGARPLYLSAGLILEEGVPMETLWRVIQSMRSAADRAGVQVVTGDTKVVDRGKGDGIYINTSGVGLVESGVQIAPDRVKPGDLILLSGDIGRHGIAIMAVREGLEFENPIQSDLAPLSGPVLELLSAGLEIHCLRDLTRGGLASALNEIAEAAGIAIAIDEGRVPVREEVKGACEILGLDPLYVANEGRFIAFIPRDEGERALKILRNCPSSADASLIGEVTVKRSATFPGGVIAKSKIGVDRVIDLLSGEQLPRIC